MSSGQNSGGLMSSAGLVRYFDAEGTNTIKMDPKSVLAFGAFFDTGTKAPKTRAPIDILEWWSVMMVVPSVAIGGITAQNCPTLVRAGADFLAVSAGVWGHADGPAAAVAAINAEIRKTLETMESPTP